MNIEALDFIVVSVRTGNAIAAFLLPGDAVKYIAYRRSVEGPNGPAYDSIPGRTGSINAQLDRYKASQQRQAAADAKARAAATKAARAEAKALLNLHQPAMVAKMGAKLGASALKATLKSMAYFEPEKCIRVVAKFVREQEVAA